MKFLNRIKILSGAQLKYIAFLSMLIDHMNKALLYPYLDGGVISTISNIFGILGRIAFPIFIFLLVEGYFNTRNRWRYLGTLLLFAVISEVPFDMCSTSSFYEANWNNILFTFVMVLVTIWIIDVLKGKMKSLPAALWYVVSVLILAVMCLAAMHLGVDYEHHAILIGYFLYLFHGKPLVAIPCSYLSMYQEPWALLGFGLALTYNGERGQQYKWFNYFFYPVHLLIIGILRMYLGV